MKRIKIDIPEYKKEIYSRLREKFNPEDSHVRKYQLHLSNVLKEFDIFCRKNDIVYYLAYGTLLGAVRHKGFIPWDDDADLWMDRENYEKLRQLMHRIRKNVYQLTDNISVTMGARPELWSPPFAYVDIFILDESPDNIVHRVIKEISVAFLYAMRKCRVKYDKKNFGKFKPYYVLLPFALLRTNAQWKEKFEKLMTWHVNANNSPKFLQIYNNCFKNIFDKYPADKTLWQLVEIEFEGHWYYAPSGFHELLQRDYGDYMQIPAEVERSVHGYDKYWNNEDTEEPRHK